MIGVGRQIGYEIFKHSAELYIVTNADIGVCRGILSFIV